MITVNVPKKVITIPLSRVGVPAFTLETLRECVGLQRRL